MTSKSATFLVLWSITSVPSFAAPPCAPYASSVRLAPIVIEELAVKGSGEMSFIPITSLSDGCVSLQEVGGESTEAQRMIQVSPFTTGGLELETEYKISLRHSGDTDFGMVAARANRARAVRTDRTITLYLTADKTKNFNSQDGACRPADPVVETIGASAVIVLEPVDGVADSFTTQRRAVWAYRAAQAGVPRLSSDGSVRLEIANCPQNDTAPDIFFRGFFPGEAIAAESPLSEEVLRGSSSEIVARLFRVSAARTFTNPTLSVQRSFGEEISDDGSPISTNIEGLTLDFGADSSGLLINSARLKAATTNQLNIGLSKKARAALTACTTKRGTIKKRHRLVKQGGTIVCRSRGKIVTG